MGDSDDDLFAFTNTNELPEYPYQFEASNFGPDRNIVKCRQPIIPGNAARERTRVKTLRGAFLELQRTLPAVPPDTKLSKLDVLVLATTYIAHLMRTLNEGVDDNQLFAANGIMHPVKKWPMRSRLYAGILSSACPLVPKKPSEYEEQQTMCQIHNGQVAASVAPPCQLHNHTATNTVPCQVFNNNQKTVATASCQVLSNQNTQNANTLWKQPTHIQQQYNGFQDFL